MNILSIVRRLLVALTAGIALCAAPLALATTVTLHPTGFSAAGSETFDVTGEPFSPLQVGAFVGTFDANPTVITFFCFDLGHTFSFGTPYQYDDSIVSGGKFDELSRLFTEGFGSATSTADFSAGFQLAVWEILMQVTPDDVNSPDGSFYVIDAHGNTGAVTRANTLLAGLSGSNAGYTIHFLHSLSTDPQHQDFVYGTPTPLHQEVPEPAPLLLIGAALVAMLFALRRNGRGQRA